MATKRAYMNMHGLAKAHNVGCPSSLSISNVKFVMWLQIMCMVGCPCAEADAQQMLGFVAVS